MQKIKQGSTNLFNWHIGAQSPYHTWFLPQYRKHSRSRRFSFSAKGTRTGPGSKFKSHLVGLQLLQMIMFCAPPVCSLLCCSAVCNRAVCIDHTTGSGSAVNLNTLSHFAHSQVKEPTVQSSEIFWVAQLVPSGEVTPRRHLGKPIISRSWNYELLEKSFHFNHSLLLVTTVITCYSHLCASAAVLSDTYLRVQKLWSTYSDISRILIV